MVRIDKINDRWGSIVHGSYDDIINMNLSELGYQRDMIVFRGLGKITELQYYKLLEKFGEPWDKQKYQYSTENWIPVDYEGKEVFISKFSNKTATRLGGAPMPWHVDIPNHGEESFPWRCLYMINNPNPEAGLTTWMNLRLDNIQPAEEELEYYQNIEVLNQSWYRYGEELNKNSLIKKHPVTGVESLRLNYFVDKKNPFTSLAWIKKTYVNGSEFDNMEVIGSILKRLSQREDLTYTHSWQNYDLIMYDNWNLIHRRTSCKLKSDEERLFLRANVKHIYTYR